MSRDAPIAADAARVNVAVVIPAFQAVETIERVLAGIPAWVYTIIVVDDGSSDGTAARVTAAAEADSRIQLVRHPSNQGVAATMVSGIGRALQCQAQIVVKMDSDDQMSSADLPELLAPLLEGQADCAKGNRFRDFQALRQMPPLRRMGNLALSLMCKAAVGYWNLFDPTNGFVAVRADVLHQIPWERLRGYYFFETALLGELYLAGAVVRDVPIPARYGEERSNLSLLRALAEYPPRLAWLLLRRVGLKYFLYDFSVASLYLLAGLPLLATGTLYGAVNWWHYSRLAIGAPTGTVVIPALLILLGAQLLLAAVQADLESIPRRRLARSPLVRRRLTPPHPPTPRPGRPLKEGPT